MHQTIQLPYPAGELLALVELQAKPQTDRQILELGRRFRLTNASRAISQLKQINLLVRTGITRNGAPLFQARSAADRLCEDAAHLDELAA